MSDRTFKVQSPHFTGDDVHAWQQTLQAQFKAWKVDHPLKADGDYGVGTRDATATVLYGLGILHRTMEQGVAPELRIKVRNHKLTVGEKNRAAKRADWRRDLRDRYGLGSHVAPPLAKILSHSWGWHPPVHDGVDLICREDAPIFALCDAEVVDVRSSGWWGKGAQPSAGHPVGDGDGIIQIRCTVDAGPFRKGLVFGYGHAEHAWVAVGEKVRAGQQLGKAGFANASHVHFMARGPHSGPGRPMGVGDRDPWPFVAFALEHSK